MAEIKLRCKKVYIDEIKSGEKTSEYREFSEFYLSRLTKRDKKGLVQEIIKHDTIMLYAGNVKDSEYVRCKLNDTLISQYIDNIPEGFSKGDVSFEFLLGEIIDSK